MVRWCSLFREFIGELWRTNTQTNGEPVRTNWYAVPGRENEFCDYGPGCVRNLILRFRSQKHEFCRYETMNTCLSEKDLAQARLSRARLLKARSSEILAVANWCISLKRDSTAHHFSLKFHVVQWFRRSFSLQSIITLKTPQSQVVIAHYT